MTNGKLLAAVVVVVVVAGAYVVGDARQRTLRVDAESRVAALEAGWRRRRRASAPPNCSDGS